MALQQYVGMPSSNVQTNGSCQYITKIGQGRKGNVLFCFCFSVCFFLCWIPLDTTQGSKFRYAHINLHFCTCNVNTLVVRLEGKGSVGHMKETACKRRKRREDKSNFEVAKSFFFREDSTFELCWQQNKVTLFCYATLVEKRQKIMVQDTEGSTHQIVLLEH